MLRRLVTASNLTKHSHLMLKHHLVKGMKYENKISAYMKTRTDLSYDSTASFRLKLKLTLCSIYTHRLARS
jgi:hypothetical protein